MVRLRPYQFKAVEEIRKAFQSGKRTVLFQAPTGSGKTVLFSYIAHNAFERGRTVTVCVHRVELLRQVCGALDKYELPYGIIAPGYRPDYKAALQVASIQTLVNRTGRYSKPGLIVFDEAHHATASTWEKVLMAYNGSLVLGVTATPCRLSGKGLGHAFEHLILGPRVRNLMAEGFLSRCRVFAPAQVDVTGIKRTGGDYNKQELSAAMNKPKITGDAIEHYKKHADSLPAVAFCVSIEHAKEVSEAFTKAGYASVHVDGSMTEEERASKLNGLASGKYKVITSCDLISEGVDVPCITVGILLRPTQSTSLYLQQVGRCLRPAPGKKEAIILDHAGNAIKHGLPDQDRDWTLEEGLKEENRPKLAKAWRCPVCFAVHEPAVQCPVCGYIYPAQEREKRRPVEVDGQLVELTTNGDSRKDLLSKCKTLAEVQKLGKALGYDGRWAYVYWSKRANKAKPKGTQLELT